MPLESISDVPQQCQSQEHNPPQWICLEPGTYKHTCPQCGAVQIFDVRPVTFQIYNKTETKHEYVH